MPVQLIKIESAPDLVDKVYRSLLDAISDGSMAPGARIRQEDIAEQLAVSRQPVLQALRLLKKTALCWTRPAGECWWHRSTSPGWSRFTRCAVRWMPCPPGWPRAHYQIDPKLITQGRAAARGNKVKAMMAADVQFHAGIYAASVNPLIAQSAQLHWQHIRRAMGAVLQLSTMRESIWDEHEAIATAIGKGDENAAEALTRQHGEEADRNLASLLTSALKHQR